MMWIHRIDINFQIKHIIKYEFLIIKYDVRIMKICIIWYQFYVFFDREEVIG